MPQTDTVFYGDSPEQSPSFEWLSDLKPSVRDKLNIRIQRLESEGHLLRRPESDFLRDGIHELRARRQNVNYRLLYGFSRGTAVLLHGCTKEAEVDDADIDRAINRLAQFDADPAKHSFAPNDDLDVDSETA